MKDSHWERKMREKFSFLYPSEQVSKDISRGFVIGIIIVSFIPIGWYAFSQVASLTTTHHICFEDYKTQEEYLNAVNKYMDEELTKNRNATEEITLNQTLSRMSALDCEGSGNSLSKNGKAYLIIKLLTHVTDQYAGNLYFVSRQDFGNTCSTEDVDWNIAVRALSEYHYANENHDTGPAEIQRHFEENCKADLKIYADYVNG